MIQDMTNAIEGKNRKAKEIPTPDSLDLSLVYGHLFTPASILAMKNRLLGLSLTRLEANGETACDWVNFFSVICSEEDVYTTAQSITKDINDLSEKGFVTGCLTPLSMVEFHKPLPGRTFAVYCFVSLTEEGSQFAKTCQTHNDGSNA